MNFTVKNKRTQSSFCVSPQQTVLTAALESGLALPHSCRVGNCGSCKARLISGQVDNGGFDESALTNEQSAQGFILLCGNKATSDIEIDIEEFSEQIMAAKFWPARIQAMKLLCHDVMGVTLKLPPGQKIDYLAGQYIDFVLTDNRRRSFSIANVEPEGQLEFHIRKVEDGEFTSRIFNDYKTGDVLRLYGPLGTFFIRKESEKPIIMLAGGTGFAPIKALLEDLEHSNNQCLVKLYWGVRTVDDIYMKFWLEKFSQSNEWFNFTVVLSEPADTWSGRKGFVHQAILDDHDELSNYDIYTCGPPIMITTAKKSFIEKGLNENSFYFDSFDYSLDSLAQINKQISNNN